MAPNALYSFYCLLFLPVVRHLLSEYDLLMSHELIQQGSIRTSHTMRMSNAVDPIDGINSVRELS